MDYKTYREEKEKMDLTKFLRHDCMNIYKSLELVTDEYVAGKLAEQFNIKNAQFDNIIDNFTNKVDFLKHKKSEIKVVNKGVVNTLKTIFENISDDATLYLPEDVYPVYQQIAEETHKKYIGYRTFEMYDYYELYTVTDSVILVTLPSKPIEFNVTLREIKKFVENGNIVIIDAVYLREDNYNFKEISELDNVIIIHSLSKSFMQVKKLGFVLDNTYLNIPYDLADEETKSKYNAILNLSNTNEILKKLIPYGWVNQHYNYETIMSFVVNPRKQYSYFALIKGTYQENLDKGILTIPLSVFGVSEEEDENYTIITPLLWLSDYLKGIKNS